MGRVTTVVIALTRILHWVSGIVLLGLMLLISAHILGRWLLGGGVRGTVELTQLAMVGIVFLAFAYAQVRGDHITVDLLYLRLSRTGKALMDAFASVVTLGVLVLMAWQLVEYRAVLEAGGRVTNTLRLPLHPYAWVAIVGTAVFALATLVMALRIGRRPSEDDGSSDHASGV